MAALKDAYYALLHDEADHLLQIQGCSFQSSKMKSDDDDTSGSDKLHQQHGNPSSSPSSPPPPPCFSNDNIIARTYNNIPLVADWEVNEDYGMVVKGRGKGNQIPPTPPAAAAAEEEEEEGKEDIDDAAAAAGFRHDSDLGVYSLTQWYYYS